MTLVIYTAAQVKGGECGLRAQAQRIGAIQRSAVKTQRLQIVQISK